MIRKSLIFLAIILSVILIWNLELVSYGVSQGYGQMRIIWGARPIDEVQEDPLVPDSVKQSLQFVREVVNFGVKEIGLEDRGNYQTYYDQQGKPLLFVVTAAQPFALEAYEWVFPIVGKVPYKGFFDPEDAEKELEEVQRMGYDAYIRNPSGWSTLGWFNDPILSGMLERSKGNLTNTILHELTHATIFVKDSIEYNENLATFIGDEATLQFLKQKFGENSSEYKTYIEEELDYEIFVNHILRGAAKLDSLYRDLENENVEAVKVLKKNDLIQKIVDNTDTLSFYHPDRFQWDEGVMPNNAYFMSFLRYQSQQGNFKSILKSEFNNDLKKYVMFLKEKYG